MLDFELLEPQQSRALIPWHNAPAWVYKFKHPSRGFMLSLATHGEPGSGKLSLGGFRIAPRARVESAGYNNDREALELAVGMEGKIRWSRLVQAGGPIGIKNLQNIVGGKCVLFPENGSRVGEADDFALLDFAIEVFSDFERRSGLSFNTGQDLGHGVLSDKSTYSLDYVSSKTGCCINTDTSHPTAEGNFQLVCGMLRGLGIDPTQAHIGLIGCGKIGGRILVGLREMGAETSVLEASEARRKEIEAELDCETFAPEEIAQFFKQPLQALIINANAASLSPTNLNYILGCPSLKIICGSENLPFVDSTVPDTLHKAGKLYCPTELGGMFGYLTAAEVFYSRANKAEFKMDSMLEAAAKLEEVGEKVTRAVLANNYKNRFDQHVELEYRA